MISNLEELKKAATLIAIDRKLPIDGTFEEKNEHYGWRALADELYQWNDKLTEVLEQRDASRKWRAESGYDAAVKASSAAHDRAYDAQCALLAMQPTTPAGLLAQVDWLAANAEDLYELEVAFATLAASVRALFPRRGASLTV